MVTYGLKKKNSSKYTSQTNYKFCEEEKKEALAIVTADLQ